MSSLCCLRFADIGGEESKRPPLEQADPLDRAPPRARRRRLRLPRGGRRREEDRALLRLNRRRPRRQRRRNWRRDGGGRRRPQQSQGRSEQLTLDLGYVQSGVAPCSGNDVALRAGAGWKVGRLVCIFAPLPM